MCATAAFAQTGTVSGVVKDVAGEPLIGVNVLVKGTTNGAITDIDGNYSVQNVPAQSILVFSYIGYVTQEIPVGNQRNITVELREDTQRLDEVVVVGYSTQQKKDITGSVAVVDTKELLKSTGSSAMAQLQGKVAGIQISTSSSAGGNSMVRIRGVNSVNNNGPLYVIDGISTRNQNLNSINPNDIESLQVLKDASASAIYGAQASNGVILITTKKGVNTGQPVFTYDAYYGWQVPGKKYDLLNSKDRMDLEYKGMLNQSINNGTYDPNNPESWPSHELFKTSATGFTPYPYQSNTQGGIDSYDMNTYNFAYPGLQVYSAYADADWWDIISRDNAPVQNHQFGLRGGNDKGQYNASVNIYDQKSTLVYSYYRRYSTRLNTSFNIRPWLRFGEDFAYSWWRDLGVNNESTEGTLYSQAYRATPWVGPYDLGGNFNGSVIPGTGNWNNPLAQIARQEGNYWTGQRLNLSAWMELDLFKDLTFTSRLGIEYTNGWYYRMDKINLEFSESPRTNNLQEQANFNIRRVWQNTLQYKTVFNDVHRLTALIGTEAINDGIGRTLTGQRYNYLFENDVNTWTLSMGERNDQREANSSYNGEYALFGIFGRVDYSFQDKYLFTGTLRRDGASRLSKSNRYGTFPSVSLGWRVSGEDFMESTRDWLDDLKLRFGWGQVGNVELPSAINWASTYSLSADQANYPIDGSQSGSTGFRQTQIGNEDTKWEAVESINVGLDASLLKGKFGIGIEYFNKKTTNMLIRAAYSDLAGEANAPFINYGSMENNGFEATLNYFDGSGDWSWNATLTLTHVKNKIISLSENPGFILWTGGNRIINEGQIARTTAGFPMAQFWGYKVDGVYENTQQVNALLPRGVSAQMSEEDAQQFVGYHKFVDVNKDGKLDDVNDRTLIGDPNPDLIAGLNLGVNYKNFDLTLFWFSQIGNDLFNNTLLFTDFQQFRGNRSTRMRDNSWEPNKPINRWTLPQLNAADNYSGIVSSYFVEDGSYLRLNNMVLGYTLPKPLLQKLTISNLRVYFQLENALTFTKYTGLDPQVGNRINDNDSGRDLGRGIDGGGNPNVIRYLFGLNFAF
jgi:TonB-linked SusC/RagA family outer membrane protein